MLSCLICFKSLEYSSEHVMCIPQCGHVFHENCVNRWLELNPSCPKCRIFCSSETLLKLFFGTDTLDNESEDLNHEIKLLKYRSQLSKLHIENYLEDIINHLDLMADNTNNIILKKREIIQIAQDKEQENLMRFKLKDLFVSLNRQEESKRIDDYLQSRNKSN
ncbi:unnamed protein product [Diamesa serratosioi]